MFRIIDNRISDNRIIPLRKKTKKYINKLNMYFSHEIFRCVIC